MLIQREAKEFCLSTYAHGFKLIALPHRSLLERVLWIIITAVFILAAITLSWLTWYKITTAPTITQTDSPNYPIWNYPFPAVTVCNFNIISKKQAYKVAQQLKKPQNVTVEELAWSFRLLYHLIDTTSAESSQHAFAILQDILDDNDVFIEELMRNLAPNCKDMLQRCSWKGQNVPCDRLFQQIKTPEGFCCSFNYFGLKNNTFNRFITSTKYRVQNKPRRVSATGYQTALETVVNSLPEDYFATPFASYGHMVIVHHPYSFPEGNSLRMLQSTKGLIFIGVKPILYRPDTRLASLRISDRKCLFKEERELHYFEYTYYNCASECRANITKELCGCTPFYYHYGPNNNDSRGDNRVCNLRDISCLFENKYKIANSLPGHKESSETLKKIQNWRLYDRKCPCLPDCVYCYYAIEGSAGEFHKEYAGNKPTLYGGVNFINQSVFRVYFDDLVSTRFSTSVRYYWHTTLGLFGGILGLLTGFSIVSLIEMVYFFTIRIILDLIVQKKANKKKMNLESKLFVKEA